MKRLLLTITYCIALLLPTQFIEAFSWSTALTNVTTSLTNWYNSYRSQSTTYQLLMPAAAIATLVGGGLYYTYFSQTQPPIEPEQPPQQPIEPAPNTVQGPALTLQEIAAQNIARQIQQNPNKVLDLPENILNLIAKEYYLSVNEDPSWFLASYYYKKPPAWLKHYFEGVSINDLLRAKTGQWLRKGLSAKGLSVNKVLAANNDSTLDLSRHNINSLEGIDKIPNINLATRIDLHTNKLVSLPNSFNPQNLQWLNLGNNQLQTLPDNFNSQNLQAFSIHNNQLQALPDNFNPQNLHTLDLSNNQLQALPTDFNPPRLKDLNIRRNPMSKETIAQLRERMPHVQIYADY